MDNVENFQIKRKPSAINYFLLPVFCLSFFVIYRCCLINLFASRNINNIIGSLYLSLCLLIIINIVICTFLEKKENKEIITKNYIRTLHIIVKISAVVTCCARFKLNNHLQANQKKSAKIFSSSF